jgi:hypothetical protein
MLIPFASFPVFSPLIARVQGNSRNKRFGGSAFCRQSFGAALAHFAQG